MFGLRNPVGTAVPGAHRLRTDDAAACLGAALRDAGTPRPEGAAPPRGESGSRGHSLRPRRALHVLRRSRLDEEPPRLVEDAQVIPDALPGGQG